MPSHEFEGGGRLNVILPPMSHRLDIRVIAAPFAPQKERVRKSVTPAKLIRIATLAANHGKNKITQSPAHRVEAAYLQTDIGRCT